MYNSMNTETDKMIRKIEKIRKTELEEAIGVSNPFWGD